jgi:protein-S-isoprenylcysteine O-methyltransferase Ste14
MLGGFYQSGMILGTAITFYIIDFILIKKYDKQRNSKGTARSWDFTILMFLVVCMVAIQPLLLPWMGLHLTGVAGLIMQLAGLACLVMSIGLNIWARRHLQQFYAERVEIQLEHRIIDTGPYAYVRHPVFTSLFGLVIGLVLVNPALPTLILAVYTFLDFTKAARQEEALLSKNLPGYLAYIERTNAFIPQIIKFKEA